MAKDMTGGNLALTLVKFSIPLILSGLLQQLYSWADAFIVGNVAGEGALAAIGATGSLTALLIMAITGFTSGVSILAARHFGAGETAVQKRILFTFGFVLAAAFLALSAAGVLGSGVLLRLLKTPSDIFIPAREYLRIIFLGIPCLAVYNVYAAVLQGVGDSRAPFRAVLLSSAANVLLDILFVWFFHGNVAGAAWATVISQGLMALYLVLYARHRYDFLRFRPGRELLDRTVWKNGCTLALPIMIQSLINALGNVLLQKFMNGFGTPTVAAITTAYRVDSVILLPVVNLGTGIATITSQNLGAGQTERARRCLRAGCAITLGVSVVLTALVLAFGGDLIELFGVTENSARIGRNFFRALASFYGIFGLCMAMSGYLDGTGRVLFTGIASVLALGLRIVLSYALKPVYDNMVIAWAEVFSWCFLLLVLAGGVAYTMRSRSAPGKRDVL